MFAEVPQPPQVGRRAVGLGLALCLAVVLCGSVARAQSVAFINPGKSDEVYWVTAAQAMQAAARSLRPGSGRLMTPLRHVPCPSAPTV